MLASLKVNSLADKKRKDREDDPRRWSGSPLLGKGNYRPLPALLEAYECMIAARGDKDWKKVGYHAMRVCDHWANLPQTQRDALEGAFPGAPDFLGDWSGVAWVSYLAALTAVPERRERLGRALRAAVGGGGGGRSEPDERQRVCGNIPAEIAF